MKLLFKQRLISWFDSYDIYDEYGKAVYIVKGQLSLGHCLKIYDTYENEIGTVKERIIRILPEFEMYLGNEYIGCISRELSFFIPKYNIDCNGWHVEGDLLQWDYKIFDASGNQIAALSKEPINWTDTYVLDIADPKDALYVLMLVLAIDAEKCHKS